MTPGEALRPEELIELSSAIDNLREHPGWLVVQRLLQAEQRHVTRVGLRDYNTPREFFDGYLTALDFFIDMPEQLVALAKAQQEITKQEVPTVVPQRLMQGEVSQ